MPESSTHYWLIRSPYQNRTWDDCLMRNLFRLQGIRNAEAARNIGRMQPGDQAIFYNNIDERAVFGILEVSAKPYSDPTSNESCWLAIDSNPIQTFDPPLPLESLKQNETLASCPLITRPRLSVAVLSEEHFQTILNMAQP
jgi:predicted RNA-binding protein with PUA-like domain